MTAQLGSAVGEIRINTGGVDKAAASTKRAFGSMKTSLSSTTKIMGGALVGATAVLVGGLAAVTVSGVKMAMSLEEQMSRIQAVMGASTEEVKLLENEIVNLGLNPNLKVTTEEAAAAIEMLGRNGLKTTDILNGAAEATVLLANATGADFATAADIGTDAMAIFKIEAKDMLGAVSGITSVTTNSKFGIEGYSLALAQAGGIAASSGVSFNDFNTSIAAISPLFASGSDAGTSFKTMLQRLIPASGPAGDAMSELGLLAADGSNAFFDANGNMKDMGDIAVILQGSLAGLSEEQRNTALQTIFGTDASRAAIGVMEAGADANLTAAQAAEIFGVSIQDAARMVEDGITKYDVMQATMGKTDAMEAAATRMDNLAGVVEILGGIFDAVKLKIGQGILPVLRLLADRALELSEQALPKIESALDGVSGFIEMVVNNFDTLVKYFGAVVDDGDTLNDWLSHLPESIRPLVQSIGDFVAKVIEIASPITTAVASFVSWKDVLVALGLFVGGALLTALYAIATAIAPIILVAGAVIGVIALLRNAWENDWGGIQEKVQTAVSFIGEKFAEAKEFVGSLISYFGAVLGDGDPLNDWLTHLPEGIRPAVQAVGEFVTKLMEIGAEIEEAIQPAIDVLSIFAEQIIESFQEGGLAGAVEEFKNLWPGIKTAVMVGIKGILKVIGKHLKIDGLAGKFDAFRARLSAIWTDLKGIVSGAVALIWSSIQEFASNFAGSLSAFAPLMESFRTLWESLKPVLKIVMQLLGAIAAVIIGVTVGSFQGLANAIGPFMETIANTVNHLMLAFAGFFDFISATVAAIVALFQGDTEAASAAWERMKDAILMTLQNLALMAVHFIFGMGFTLAEFLRGFVEGIIGFFQHLYDVLVGNSIIPDLVNAIIAWILSMKTQFTTMVQTLVTAVIAKFQQLLIAVGTKMILLVTKIKTKLAELKASWAEKWDAIKTKATQIWNAIKSIAITKVNAMKTAVLSKIDALRSAIAGKVSAFRSVGSALINGMKAGVESVAGSLVEAAKGVVSDAIAAAKALLGMKSPSRVFKDIGINTIQGMVVGLESMRKRLSNTMVNSLSPAIDQARQRMAFANQLNAVPSFAGVGMGTAVSSSVDNSKRSERHIHIGQIILPNVQDSRGLLAELKDLAGGEEY